MVKQVFIGIDPGVKGAICILDPTEGKAIFLNTTDDARNLINTLTRCNDEVSNVRCIMIEDVHSIHGMSAKSNFQFGANVGRVNTVAEATGFMVDKVTPKKWQKEVGVKSTTKGKAIKPEVAEICSRLYPDVSIRGPKGGLLDGRSDALMIAHYCYLKHKMS
jgi:hypothetical protein